MKKRIWGRAGPLGRSLRVFIAIILLTKAALAGMPEKINGVYLPPGHLSARNITTLLHYYRAAGLNAVVLHVKDPFGRVHWKAENGVAREIGAASGNGSLEAAVGYFNAASIWTIAKIDVFADDLLAEKVPERAVLNMETGRPWADRKGLRWTDPHDREVWAYNLDLCVELAAMGFKEIQFDYIRFPSDGELRNIRYPSRMGKAAPSETIGEFLATARERLSKLGVVISIDVFGLTAWKRGDFGVGQVLEEMVPHVDVVCPMFYPSHFPVGFLGWKEPSGYPEEIMTLGMSRMDKRTEKNVRPWVQGFWYAPEEIAAQIGGIEKNGGKSWMVWNPSADYGKTFAALAMGRDIHYPPFRPYSQLPELRRRGSRTVSGQKRIVNYTDYDAGYSILSLEESDGGYRSPYGTPVSVVHTLDEAILDRALRYRNLSLKQGMGKWRKASVKAAALLRELGLDPRRLRPFPIYLTWGRGAPSR